VLGFFAWAWSPSGPGPFRSHGTSANAHPAFGLYGRAPDGEGYTPQAIQVLTLVGDRIWSAIARLHGFVRPDLFGQFGPAAQAMMRAMAYDEELAARIRAALADRNRSARILQSPQRLTSDSRALPECL
jgi:hypothetical protein